MYLFPNPKEDYENLKYLVKHKYHVYKAGRALGLPRGQLLKHDLSKLSPSEWTPYKTFFFNKKHTPRDYDKFRQAVTSHHYPNNPHHGQYWKSRGQNMPRKFKLEQLADWYGAGKAQGRISKNQNFIDWLDMKAKQSNE